MLCELKRTKKKRGEEEEEERKGPFLLSLSFSISPSLVLKSNSYLTAGFKRRWDRTDQISEKDRAAEIHRRRSGEVSAVGSEEGKGVGFLGVSIAGFLFFFITFLFLLISGK